MYLGPSYNVLKVRAESSRIYDLLILYDRLLRWRRQDDDAGILEPFVTSGNGIRSPTCISNCQFAQKRHQTMEYLISTFLEVAGVELADPSLCSGQRLTTSVLSFWSH